ncbi:MAG: NADH-quinone oxidoreductase subunit J [Candidatus Odinarchaeota archaeon]
MQGFDPALFEQIEFLLLAGIVLVLAYLALEHKELVYAAFFFGFMASFVAGFFLLLEAPFIAGMQIAVYTGGISTLIIFAVLLLPRAQDSTLEKFAPSRARKTSLLIAVIVTMISGFLALIFPWAESFNEAFVNISQDLSGLAQWLWFDNGIYTQMIALIMITSLVGAISLLRMDKAEQLSTVIGKFGIEAEPLITDEVTSTEDEQSADKPMEVDE